MSSLAEKPYDLTKRLHRYDQKYRLGDLRGHAASGAALQVVAGPVVVVAPHAVALLRDGRPKAAEFFTGSIAELCSDELGWSAVTALRIYDDRAQPNPLERAVRATVHAVAANRLVEIHGMSGDWNVDIAIGTAGHDGSMSKAHRLRDLLGSCFRVEIDHPFNGGSSLSARLRPELEVAAALHIELGPRLRSDATPDSDLRALLDALSEACQ